MGLTVLDAGVIIGLSSPHDAHFEGAKEQVERASGRRDRLATSTSGLAEVLVGPFRAGSRFVEAALAFLEELPIDVVPIDKEIGVEAARLRASVGTQLRLPDALVIATARVLNADVLVTTDRRWPAKRALGFRGNLIVI